MLKHACGERDRLLCYTPAEVNLREPIHITHAFASANNAAHSDFETERRRHQNSEKGVSVAPKMDMCPVKI